MSVVSSVNLRLRGQKALVTGGGSGLGLLFASVLAQNGARVVIAGRRESTLESALMRLREQNETAEAVCLDVTDPKSIESTVDQLEARGLLPDILINNAGLSRPGPALKVTVADFDAVMSTNLRGAFLLSQATARKLIAIGRPGVIVNVCSVLGRSPQKSVLPYAVSKAGLLHLTRLLALEWARHSIRVNALVPGFFRTDITDEYLDSLAGAALQSRIPMRRPGWLPELAQPLMLLVDPDSVYMTGTELVVDGGLSVNPL